MRTRLLAISILALLCVPAHAASSPTWLEVTTPHFTVVTDAGEKQARHVAAQFERMQLVFHKLVPDANSDPGSPIVVLALKNRRDFQSLQPAAYLAKGSMELAGLFLQNTDRNYILVRLDAEGEHPFSTVYHEYTHYITRHGNLPLWLNEGVAEFYQNTDIDAHEARLGQPSKDDIEFLRQNSLVPVTTLFAVDHNSPYYHDEQKGTIFYSESWALTDLLIINDHRNKTSLLGNYIRALMAGQNSIQAAQTAFGDLKQLQKALQTQVSDGDYSFFRLAIETPIDENSFQLTPLTEPDADAFRADVLVSDGRTDDAQKLLDAVLAANPSNALAHESEGMLHFREHDLAAARKAYTEATQLHSTSYLAWYYAAVLALQQGDRNDPAIEPELQQSLKLNPNFAPANDTLATFYANQRQNLDEALHLSLLAVVAEPDELHYRLSNAFIHMQRQELPSALAVLNNARPLAHSPGEIAELNSRLEQVHRIQDFQARAAAEPTTYSARSSEPTVIPGGTVTTVALNSQPKEGVTDTVIVGGKPHPELAVTPATDDPHFPTVPLSGPHHIARGVLHDVHCLYPTVLSFTVTGGPKPVSLYTNNMYKIDFVAGNFTPKETLNPCKLDGANVFVTWTAVNDPRVAGQIVSIQINK
jgi:hypothetical protein